MWGRPSGRPCPEGTSFRNVYQSLNGDEMTTFHEYLGNDGHAPEWPYAIRYDQEQVIDTDVLVIGGGIAGCWAAISAAPKGVRVALVEKSATIRSGAGGPGCDHW